VVAFLETGMTITRRILWVALLAGSAVSLLVCQGIGSQSLIVGSPEGGWAYAYRQPFTAGVFGVFALVGVAAAVLAVVPWRQIRRHEGLAVLAWLVLGFAGQATLRSLTPFTFAQIFGSDTANSFYTPTLHRGATELLTDFDRLRASLPLHAKSNMPGKLVFVSGLHHLSPSPAGMAWLVVIVSNFGGVLLYVFVRDLFRDRRVALFSLILYLFVPAKLYFFPLLNTVTPVLAIACACLLMRWLVARSAACAAAFGASVYALMFFEPLPLVMGLLFAGLIVRALWRADIGGKTLLWQSGVALAAFAATYWMLVAMFNFDLFSAFHQAQKDAAAFNIEANRPYGTWVWQNPLDFAFGVGWCQVVIFMAVLGDVVRRCVTSGRQLGRPIAVLTLGLAAVLLATDLLGINRGEVTRLWIFLACFFQIPAAYACARLNSRVALMLVLGTALLQAALGTAMIGFIVP
jgi:hypothetical protein